MRKVTVVLAAVMFLFVLVNAAVAAPAPAQMKNVSVSAASNDMTGRLGIGTNGSGIGARYWLNDDMALDGNLSFSFGEDDTEFGIGGGIAYILKKMAYLRFLALAGIQIDFDNFESTNFKDEETTINIGGGLGVDFRFQEIPNLSFEVYVSRLGIDIVSTDTTVSGNTTSDSTTTFATKPGVGFAVRYYF
ncbi:MAG: hypothetical protein PHD29_05640 [bacterium]|nr:hypothetical protein [bacterium]MDD5353609.1 hypothetical protein [bacterium]MDD5757194.1 hypothetical protein [bacterium]